MLELVIIIFAIVQLITVFLAFFAYQDALKAKYPQPTHTLDNQMRELTSKLSEIQSEVNNLKLQNSMKT